MEDATRHDYAAAVSAQRINAQLVLDSFEMPAARRAVFAALIECAPGDRGRQFHADCVDVILNGAASEAVPSVAPRKPPALFPSRPQRGDHTRHLDEHDPANWDAIATGVNGRQRLLDVARSLGRLDEVKRLPSAKILAVLKTPPPL